MRINKYKISKKRRLRRRGKYSKKLKPKSRKSGGGWVPSFLRRVPEKKKVKIRATCDIPEFFFTSHNLFCEIMGSSINPFEKTGNEGIDISVYGELIEKKKTADDSYTLSVELDSPATATIDDVYFNKLNTIQSHDRVTTQGMGYETKKLNIAVTGLMTFNVIKEHEYTIKGDGKGMIYPIPIQCSEYTAVNRGESFVCKDTDDHILKLLLQLWRKKYTDLKGKFDDFLEKFYTHDKVNQFRDHEYRFKVESILLSSS